MNNQPWFVNLVNTPTCKAFCRLAKENEWTGSMIRNPTYSEAYHIITCNVAENTLHGRYFEPGPNYREISIDEAILIISQPPNTEKILGITVEHQLIVMVSKRGIKIGHEFISADEVREIYEEFCKC